VVRAHAGNGQADLLHAGTTTDGGHVIAGAFDGFLQGVAVGPACFDGHADMVVGDIGLDLAHAIEAFQRLAHDAGTVVTAHAGDRQGDRVGG